MTQREICPMCLSEKGTIFVHGHYQCLECKQNTYPCCSGEHSFQRAVNTEEIDKS
jgi:hypothetical protein